MKRHLASSKKGFTLVELLIVGALISLFATLAVFGVQQQYDSNVRKATVGEVRNIASSLDFANLDTSIFPRLCWLTESQEGLDFVSSLITGNSTDPAAYFRLDINGRPSPQPGSVRQQWNGPYFNISQSRAGLSRGRGGFVYMVIPELAAFGDSSTNPANVNSSTGLRWPADPYGNPYTVYMLDVNTADRALYFVTDDSNPDTQGPEAANPTRKGNYVNAVVSYGRNHYPGGGPDVIVNFGANPGSGNGVAAAEGQGPFALRLYKGVVNGTVPNKSLPTYTSLTGLEYNTNRANVWSDQFIGNVSGQLPTDGAGNPVGITDTGSDDIIYEF